MSVFSFASLLIGDARDTEAASFERVDRAAAMLRDAARHEVCARFRLHQSSVAYAVAERGRHPQEVMASFLAYSSAQDAARAAMARVGAILAELVHAQRSIGVDGLVYHECETAPCERCRVDAALSAVSSLVRA